MEAGGMGSALNSRLKRAEIASSFGAGVLGFGLGALASPYLAGMVAPVLLVGALLHGWGMFDKHAIEQGAGRQETWWMKFLYWLCWIVLAALALILAARILG